MIGPDMSKRLAELQADERLRSANEPKSPPLFSWERLAFHVTMLGAGVFLLGAFLATCTGPIVHGISLE